MTVRRRLRFSSRAYFFCLAFECRGEFCLLFDYGTMHEICLRPELLYCCITVCSLKTSRPHVRSACVCVSYSSRKQNREKPKADGIISIALSDQSDA